VFKKAIVHIDLFPDANLETDDGPVPRLDFRRQRTLN